MLDLTRIPEAVRSERGVSRRLFLAYGAALAALPSLSVRSMAADKKVTFDADPFSLGVASGDPDATSVVLWTKLAPKPLDPAGGMKPETVSVAWEVAEDDAMKKVIARGTELATPQLGHSVHAEAGGLKPDRWYFYRFTVGDAQSPIGRTRTLPAADAAPDKLKFAFASCQNYEQGLYTAYDQMAKDDLDLVFHLGDYIYEYAPADKRVRKHTGPTRNKITTLADYRERHAQYRADPLLTECTPSARGSSPGTTTSSTTITPDRFRKSNRRGSRKPIPSSSSNGGRLRIRRTMSSCRCGSGPCRPGRT
jgi:alkaline phosphatase D